MKDFGRWMAEQKAPTPAHAAKTEEDDADLPDGLWRNTAGVIVASCRVCDRTYEWPSDLSDGYDHQYSYCGRSPSCCP